MAYALLMAIALFFSIPSPANASFDPHPDTVSAPDGTDATGTR